MNKSLLKEKLKSYSALATAVFGTAAAADAQIVYTDINPDTVLTVTNGTVASYEVDFDNDGNSDVAVSTYGYLYGSYQINYSFTNVAPNTVAALLGATGSYGPEATGLSVGTFIDPAATTWMDTTAAGGTFFWNVAGMTGSGTPLAGTIATDADAYLAARFAIGANTHYGWIRINVAADALTTTIKDYAYKINPNTGLNAGETGLGINEMPATTWFAGVNGNNIVVSAKVDGAIRVVDATGRLVATGTVENGEAVIKMEDTAKGVFVISFESAGSIGTKKVVLN
jgi:hypothetical protein